MRYQFTDEHRALRELVATIAEKSDKRAALAGDGTPIDRAMWSALAGAGILGIGLGAEYDGGDAGPVEQVIVAEELGRAVSAVPFSEHAAACALIETSTAEAADELLRSLGSGDAVGAVAVGSSCHIRAESSGDRWLLRGTASLVPNAAAADIVVVPASVDGTDGTRWFAVRNAVGRVELATVDRSRPAARYVFEGAPAIELLGADVGPARALVHTLAAAEAVGVADCCLTSTSDYARQRHQFGLPIGTFQAVKHRLADALVDVENARSAVYGAAWALVDNPVDSLAVAMAQAVATSNAVHVAGVAIQLHGGIGVTWESGLHLYLRRAKALEATYGSPASHRAAIAAAVLDVDAAHTM